MSLKRDELGVKALKLSGIAVLIEIAMIFLVVRLPENSVQKVLFAVVTAPLLAAGGIMDQIFSGPTHDAGTDAVALVMLASFGFLTFFFPIWLALIVFDRIKQRRTMKPPA